MKKTFFSISIAVFIICSALLPTLVMADEEAPRVHTIRISPSYAHLRYGGDIRFTAYAWDKDGHRIKNFEPTEWRASSGRIDDWGWYVGNFPGYHTIEAIYKYTKPSSDPDEEDEIITVIGTATVDVEYYKPPRN